MRVLLFDKRNNLSIQNSVPEGIPAGAARVMPDADTLAIRVPQLDAPVGTLRSFAHDRLVMRAAALLSSRERTLFDPATGAALSYGSTGAVAHTPAGREVFPRIDPAVIGLIHLRGTDLILLGRNARRSSYYSLIAGYVEPGETLEAAMEREAWEETGRRITDLRYWGSQPWPESGSLMAGFEAWTHDRDAVGKLDGELAEIRWASPADLRTLPLSAPGSIARAMLDDLIAEDA